MAESSCYKDAIQSSGGLTASWVYVDNQNDQTTAPDGCMSDISSCNNAFVYVVYKIIRKWCYKLTVCSFNRWESK